MMPWVITAPLLSAILTMAFRDRQRRRLARIMLATIAAGLPLTIVGVVDGLSLTFTVIVSVLGLLATVFSTDTFAPDWGGGGAIWSRKSVYFVLLAAFWSAM